MTAHPTSRPVHVTVRDWLWTNHMLRCGPRDKVLVDSGYLRRADLTPEPLQHPDALGAGHLHGIINSDGHSDHIGGNAALQRRYGCRIAVPAGEAPLIRDWDTRALWLDSAGQNAERFMDDEVVSDGDTLEL
ncbi:MAG TPA: MBL fold metallo-hydrolase [Burkholderiales bacterium]